LQNDTIDFYASKDSVESNGLGMGTNFAEYKQATIYIDVDNRLCINTAKGLCINKKRVSITPEGILTAEKLAANNGVSGTYTFGIYNSNNIAELKDFKFEKGILISVTDHSS
jgi:hypothetical protein